MVTHCWSVHLPEYAQALKVQGCSLARAMAKERLITPNGQEWRDPFPSITWTVYSHTLDQRTRDAVRFVMEYWYREHSTFSGAFSVNLRPLDKEQLFRRAIGRNHAAHATTAAVVWFTDCDYFIGDGAYQAILAAANQAPSDGEPNRLYFPREVQISRDHLTGNAMLSQGDPAKSAAYGFGNPGGLPTGLFVPKSHHVAIGGIQIVSGETANRVGYLQDTKWMNPVDAAGGFRSCRCDRAFRRHNKFQSTPCDIAGIYRIRHLEAGRDYDEQGVKQAKR